MSSKRKISTETPQKAKIHKIATSPIKGVRITLSGTKKEDDTITIHNYHTPKNIGLEEAIIALYQKKEQLLEQNRDEYYKQIRNRVIK